MNSAEYNYPIHDKELLAIVRSLQKWEHLLLSCFHPFDIYTDHQSLQYFATKRKLTSRQASWNEILSPFAFQLHYRPGTQNLIANLLSRKTINLTTQKAIKEHGRTQVLLSPESFVNETNIANIFALIIADNPPTNQYPVPDPPAKPLQGILLTNTILAANRESKLFNIFRQTTKYPNSLYTLENDLLLYDKRLIIPDKQALRIRLCDNFHRTHHQTHPNRNKIKYILRAQYYWPNITTFID